MKPVHAGKLGGRTQYSTFTITLGVVVFTAKRTVELAEVV
jgi:hypothetical protein